MIGAVVGFAEALRSNGARISAAEVIDAVRALLLVPLDDTAIVREALATTLCKHARDRVLFYEIWALLVEHRLGGDDDGEPPLLAALATLELDEDARERLLALLADEAARMSPIVRGLSGLRRASIESLLLLAGLRTEVDRLASSLQAGFFAQQLWSRLSQPVKQLDDLSNRLRELLTDAQADQVRAALQQELQKRRRELRSLVDESLVDRERALAAVDRSQPLHRPLGALTDGEMGMLRKELQRLAGKLRSVARLRRTRRRRGRLDVARTMRRALTTGGVPMALQRRLRRRDKPRLVVLCDVSDSVRHTTRFMLELCYSLQELFDDVKSFVFVADVADVTDLFRHASLDRAVEQAIFSHRVNIFANSNYGRVFRLFAKKFLEHVTTRTTVVVIGDGRNNYHSDDAWAFAAITERAQRTLWLNPEPASSWSFGDSAMRAYEPLCDRVEYVNDLASLVKVIDELRL